SPSCVVLPGLSSQCLSLSLSQAAVPTDRAISSFLDRASRALASARVRARSLTTQRQSTTVPHAAVGTQLHQELDAHAHLASKVTLDRALLDLRTQGGLLILGEIFDLRGRLDLRTGADCPRGAATDAEDRRQRDHCVLAGWKVDACDTGHVPSPISCVRN